MFFLKGLREAQTDNLVLIGFILNDKTRFFYPLLIMQPKVLFIILFLNDFLVLKIAMQWCKRRQ